MSVVLKILSPGLMSSIQDYGRPGFGGDGVPRSGAADPVSLQLGNALVGNAPFEAAIEFRLLGPSIACVNGSCRIGLACQADGELKDFQSGEVRHILPWQTVAMDDGDILEVSSLQRGMTGYLTVEGGLSLTPVLGSCSTYARASLGGVEGKNLGANDTITLREGMVQAGVEKMVPPLELTDDPLRVILGPQDDFFLEAVLNQFLSSAFEVTSDADRMGVRLEGPEIKTLPEKGSDLISDGLIAGAIQIPGNGQPIVLGVDCQSVGGYPKIATVITADLHHVGQLTPGREVRFRAVELDEAQTAFLDLEKSIETAINARQDYLGEGVIDIKSLYSANLIDGVVDANPGALQEEKP